MLYVFHEHIFPFKNSSSVSSVSFDSVTSFFWPSFPSSCSVSHSPESSSPVLSPSSSSDSPSPDMVSPHVSISHPVVSPSSSSPSSFVPSIPPGHIHIGSLSIALPCSLPPVAPVVHPMLTRSKTGALPSKPPMCLTYVSTSLPSAAVEPLSVKEALQSPQWSQAMLDEFQALQQQGTWTLVSLPAHKHVRHWLQVGF